MSAFETMFSHEWLISPVTKGVFFKEYWEKQPLVVKRNQPQYFSSLLSLDDIDHALTTLDLRYPNVTLKNADRKTTSADYTLNGDDLDVAKVYQLFGEGATIVLSYLDTVIQPLAGLCRNLENEFSFPFQTNVYLTPARAKGFKAHYDTHDVFVAQVVGSKKWTMYGIPVEHPLAGQEFDASVHERGEPTLEFELEAGDSAYIPRGLVHDARSGDSTSLHVTIGVLAYTWAELLLESVAEVCLHIPDFRKALPPGFAQQGFDKAKARETFCDLVGQISKTPDFDAVLDRFVDEFISECPPPLRGQLAQIGNLDRLAMDSIVGARPGVMFHIRTIRDSFSVDCFGRKITFPSHVSQAVRFALSKAEFAVRDLPGNLDDAGKLTLVRRLIREGLLMVRLK